MTKSTRILVACTVVTMLCCASLAWLLITERDATRTQLEEQKQAIERAQKETKENAESSRVSTSEQLEAVEETLRSTEERVSELQKAFDEMKTLHGSERVAPAAKNRVEALADEIVSMLGRGLNMDRAMYELDGRNIRFQLEYGNGEYLRQKTTLFETRHIDAIRISAANRMSVVTVDGGPAYLGDAISYGYEDDGIRLDTVELTRFNKFSEAQELKELLRQAAKAAN